MPERKDGTAHGEKKSTTSDNRWWVDQGKTRERVKPEDRQAPAGAVFFKSVEKDRKSTRLNSSHLKLSRMPSSA